MTDCIPCQERRAAVLKAWQDGQIAEAVRQAAIGAAELVGIKEKADGVARQRPSAMGQGGSEDA